MMKQAILYTLLGVSLLSGCRNEDFGLTDVRPDRNELTLSVSASDFVSADGMDTRASDGGKVTDFENGDRVGIIILNKDGGIMAKNLPYKFDGTSWKFDTGNGEGKAPAYYDPLMKTFIVYYPYNEAADECKSADELKALEAFAIQSDQSTEEAYRNSDLMVWQHDEGALKSINAVLTHARASFSLAPIVKWQLADGSDLSYAPPSLEDVVIYDKDGEHLFPYEAEDGSYRYILPADYDGDIRWFYTYKEETFGGTRNVTGSESNTRYSCMETFDMGEYSLDKAAVGDFYCTHNEDGKQIGYVIPQEAASVLDEHACVGIVFSVGQSQYDTSDYSSTGIGQAQCHGYVVALQDATSSYCMWGVYGTALDLYPKDGSGNAVNNYNNPDQDWDGYKYTQTIITAAGGKGNLNATEQAGYPATYYATVSYESSVPAPSGSSGWFLPSIGQMWEVYRQRGNLRFTDAGGRNLQRNDYWSSSEHYGNPSYYALSVDVYGGYMYSWYKYSSSCYVRAVLAF